MIEVITGTDKNFYNLYKVNSDGTESKIGCVGLDSPNIVLNFMLNSPIIKMHKQVKIYKGLEYWKTIKRD